MTPDQLHNDESGAGLGVEVVHGGDVRVIEFGERTRFAAETGEELLIAGEFRRQNFEGNIAVESFVVGSIDDTHPPAPICSRIR
jgi:hypothetical protein